MTDAVAVTAAYSASSLMFSWRIFPATTRPTTG